MKVADIIVGDRFRKELGDIESLARSIEEVGLIHPPTVNLDGVLVAGLRRIEAWKLLGREEIPVTFIDLAQIIRGEHDENELRQNFTVTERVAIAEAKLSSEQEAAAERQAATLKQNIDRSGKFPEREKGEAKDKAAKAVGWSGKTFEKAKEVIETAEEDPDTFGDLPDEMDRTGKVDRTHKEMKKRKRAADNLVAVQSSDSSLNLFRGDAIELIQALDDSSVSLVVDVPAKGQGARNSALYSSDSEEWYTPPEVIGRVLKVFGVIDLDPCSDSGDTPNVPALAHFTSSDDGLAQGWGGKVYMNPPYGRVIGDWVAKLAGEFQAGNVTEAIALVPARTDTSWFQLLRDCAICFVSGRLKFSGGGNSAPFPSAAAYFGHEPDAFLVAFGDIGDVWGRIGK